MNLEKLSKITDFYWIILTYVTYDEKIQCPHITFMKVKMVKGQTSRQDLQEGFAYHINMRWKNTHYPIKKELNELFVSPRLLGVEAMFPMAGQYTIYIAHAYWGFNIKETVLILAGVWKQSQN